MTFEEHMDGVGLSIEEPEAISAAKREPVS